MLHASAVAAPKFVLLLELAPFALLFTTTRAQEKVIFPAIYLSSALTLHSFEN